VIIQSIKTLADTTTMQSKICVKKDSKINQMYSPRRD